MQNSRKGGLAEIRMKCLNILHRLDVDMKFFPMPSYRTDVDGFKLGLFLLLYGPLAPMVIMLTCDLLLALFLSAFRRADPPPEHDVNEYYTFFTISTLL